MLLALAPTMLVIAEPDLGSGLVYVAIAFAVLYIAGVDCAHLAAVAALGVAALALVLIVAPLLGFHTYQEERLTGFLDPSAVPARRSPTQIYQQEESLIAIGAGQKIGRGAGATRPRPSYRSTPQISSSRRWRSV